METINKIITQIKDQIGLSLKPCACFPGIFFHQDEQFFNVELDERIHESQDFIILERFALCSDIVNRVEPNGLKRVAVFFRGV